MNGVWICEGLLYFVLWQGGEWAWQGGEWAWLHDCCYLYLQVLGISSYLPQKEISDTAKEGAESSKEEAGPSKEEAGSKEGEGSNVATEEKAPPTETKEDDKGNDSDAEKNEVEERILEGVNSTEDKVMLQVSYGGFTDCVRVM